MSRDAQFATRRVMNTSDNANSSKESKATPSRSRAKAGAKTTSRAKASKRLRDDGLDQLEDEFNLPPGPPHSRKIPFPVELPAPINAESGLGQSVEMHRNLFCAHYDNCLDQAVKSAWNSFSCRRCVFYETTEQEEDGLETLATQRRAT